MRDVQTSFANFIRPRFSGAFFRLVPEVSDRYLKTHTLFCAALLDHQHLDRLDRQIREAGGVYLCQWSDGVQIHAGPHPQRPRVAVGVPTPQAQGAVSGSFST
jgi:hypothetical protein